MLLYIILFLLALAEFYNVVSMAIGIEQGAMKRK